MHSMFQCKLFIRSFFSVSEDFRSFIRPLGVTALQINSFNSCYCRSQFSNSFSYGVTTNTDCRLYTSDCRKELKPSDNCDHQAIILHNGMCHPCKGKKIQCPTHNTFIVFFMLSIEVSPCQW